MAPLLSTTTMTDNSEDPTSPSPSTPSNTTCRRSQDHAPHHKVKNVMDWYTLGDRIGYGGFGSIYACWHNVTGEERAMKVVAKQHQLLPPPQVNATSRNSSTAATATAITTKTTTGAAERREFLIAKEMSHPNVARVYECFEDSQNIFIIMDLYKGGDLLYAITSKLGCLSEDNTAVLIHTILTAIHYCHTEQHTAHLDLKLENIMFPHGDDDDDDDNKENINDISSYAMKDVKIIDFGLARPLAYDIDARGNTTVRPVTEVIGSTAYMAPQNFQGYFDPQKQDVFSIGVSCFMVLAGYPPFEGRNDFDVMTKIFKHDETRMFEADPITWSSMSDEAKDFVALLMSFDEGKRPTAEEALCHPWLQDARNKASADACVVSWQQLLEDSVTTVCAKSCLDASSGNPIFKRRHSNDHYYSGVATQKPRLVPSDSSLCSGSTECGSLPGSYSTESLFL